MAAAAIGARTYARDQCRTAETKRLAANKAVQNRSEMAEDAAMEEARDEHGRLIGEAHTSGRLRGADMLDASEAASSLFALQQVLQRDDAPATTKALRALTNGTELETPTPNTRRMGPVESAPRGALPRLFCSGGQRRRF